MDGKWMTLKGPLASLDLYCRKTNADNLKKLAMSIGAKLGTTKIDRRTSILCQAEVLDELLKVRQKKGNISILSIDAGISNFSYSKFEWPLGSSRPMLVGWDKFSLEKKFLPAEKPRMTLHPQDTYELCYNLTEYLTRDISILPDLFTIEKQRTRSMSSKNILEPVLKVNIMEHILYSNLKNKVNFKAIEKGGKSTFLKYMVASSDPQKMTKYWCSLTTLSLSGDSFSKMQKSNLEKLTIKSTNVTKLMKIRLVKEILNYVIWKSGDECKNLIAVSEPMQNKLKNRVPNNGTLDYKLYDALEMSVDVAGVKKDDDLADSFLHGLAWMEWLRAYKEVTDITTRNPGVCGEHVLNDFNMYLKEKNL